ncbi:MAG: translocation/assembly module TamB domain-containing protein [Kofleriaceae bacterium]
MKRGALAVVVVVVVLVISALVFTHTDYGRETIRERVEAELDKTFTGGATVGELDGSPLGELTLRHVVINGPDDQPAITIETLRLHIKLFDLLKRDIQLSKLIAEGVDVSIRRDRDGTFQLARLIRPKPADDGGGSWTVELPSIRIERAHVAIDTGTPDLQVINLDGLSLTASAHLPARGARSAGLRLQAVWRERNAPLSVAASVRDTGEQLSSPEIDVRLGGVTVAGTDLRVVRRPGGMPKLSGSVTITASKQAVAALWPRLDLPGDLQIVAEARPAPLDSDAVPLSLTGHIGRSTLAVNATVNASTQRITGTVDASELDITQLSRGKVIAHGRAAGVFDITPAKIEGALPTATVRLTGEGTWQDAPEGRVTAVIATRGTHVSTELTLSGAASAKLDAELERVGERVTLKRASLVASTPSPAKATGGKAPLHGAIKASLTAHGALLPRPALSVEGTVDGTKLRMNDLRAASLALAIDASGLPSTPRGRLEVRVEDVVRGDMELGAIMAKAANRADGKIQVEVRSRPKQDPWLIELAALVTPPARGNGSLIVDLQRHRVRAGNGVDWVGRGGRVVVSPQRIAARDLHTRSADGALAVAGQLTRAGRHSGDLSANVEIDRFGLETLRKGYAGVIDGHVEVSRRSGRWSADANIAARKISLAPESEPLDVDATVVARPAHVAISATAGNAKLGAASLALELTPPPQLESAAAWRARGRQAIERARMHLRRIDLEKLAALVPSREPIELAGRVDGEIEIARGEVSGGVQVRDLRSPVLRGVKSADLDLVLAHTAPGELSPTLTVKLAEVGTVVANARLTVPDRVFDPIAWQDPSLVRGASVCTGTIQVDPAMLARLHINSPMRARASLRVEVGEALTSIKVIGIADDLRGTPIATPVSVRVNAGIDGRAATASMAMTTDGKPLTLVKLDATIPVSIDELRASPERIRTEPLTATLELPKTSAPQLLNVFGRSEVIRGTIDGKVTLGGSLARPTVVARVVGTNLTARSTARRRQLRVIRQVVINARWDDNGGALTLDGFDERGGKLAVRAKADPDALAAARATVVATSFDVTPLLVFAPGAVGGSRGVIDANLRIDGIDPRVAKIRGDVHVREGRIPIAPTVGTLRRANIDIHIGEQEIRLGLNGRLGAGRLTVAGTIATDGVALAGGTAKLTLRKVSPISAIEPRIDADVDLKVRRDGERWIADVTVDNGFVEVPEESGERLKPIGAPSDVEIATGTRITTTTGQQVSETPVDPFVIANVTLRRTKVESKEVRTSVTGKVQITADANAIGMTGSITADTGDLDLFDRRYRIDRAVVRFDGTIDPRLDIRISHTFPDVTTFTTVRGRLSDPELELTSSPGSYSQSQLLGFLLGGEPDGAPSSGSARDKAAAIGTSLIANQLTGYVRKALPFDIDVIKYEAATVGNSASITVGTWLTHTLFFAFRQHLDARPNENTGEGVLQYWITRQLEIEATAGDRNYDGLDLLWRKRW